MDSEHETSNADDAADTADTNAATVPMGPGEKLRAARGEKGLELAFISAETRIPIKHLEAVEAEAFEDLPSRAYAIGFARSYARAVGLDETEITDAVRAELADESDRRAAISGGMEPGDPAKLPSAGLAWFGAFAAIILAAGVYAFYNTYYTSGSGLGSLLVSEDGEADEAALAAADEESPAISPDGQVVFTAMDDEIWVRFFVEGGDILYEATMKQGDTYEVPKNIADIRLNTGRPQFLEITIDGEAVPKLAEEQVTLVEPVSAAALIARFAPSDVPTASGTAATNAAAGGVATTEPTSSESTSSAARSSASSPASSVSAAGSAEPVSQVSSSANAADPANSPAPSAASAPAPAASAAIAPSPAVSPPVVEPAPNSENTLAPDAEPPAG